MAERQLEQSGVFARHDAAVYPATTRDDGTVTLVSRSDRAPAGFDLAQGPPWTRHVPLRELEWVRTVTVTATWQQHRIEILRVIDDQTVLVSYEDSDSDWAGAHLRQVDRGVWERRVPASELTDLRSDYIDLLPGLRRARGER